MNQHINPKFDETFYTAELKNGLHVVIWHKPEMKTTSAVFATPYGALDFEQISKDGKTIHHPSGIAHFLEHKMFEKDGMDVMAEFSRMGANVNAFTSYNETVYYFTTSSDEVKEPLNLLIDFVQELSITEQSVEKEKGIITQELMMYMQMPDSRLYFEVFKALYHENKLKYDIGGSATSVANTTKKQLDEAYKINYHPANMVLVVTSPKEPSEILSIIEENQANKEFDDFTKYERLRTDEPAKVAKERLLIPMEVNQTKVAVAFKLEPWYTTDKDRVHDEWAIRSQLESYFSTLNPDYQKWIDDQIINQYFDFEIDLQRDCGFILFVNETENIDDFERFIVEQMKKCMQNPIGFEVLNQLKKRYYGQAMRILNSVEDISVSVIRNAFNGVSLFDTLELLQSLSQQEVKDAIHNITLENKCCVAVVPQSKV